jgi:Zn-dependent protease
MLFIETLWKAPIFFFIQIFVVVVSVCVHELSHAWVALMQGDPTAAERGHLTLNPLKQMGPMSLIMLIFIGLAWGQVPVNPARMRHRWSHMLVAFAGPAANLGLFALCTIGLALSIYFGAPPNARLIFSLGGALNIVLFVINMLPVPGFDGWQVISYFVPRATQVKAEVMGGASLLLLLLVLVFLGTIFNFAEGLTKSVTRILLTLFLGGA